MPQQLAITGIDFAQKSESKSGELPVSEFHRLKDVISVGGNMIRFSLDGYLGARGEPLLRLQVTGYLPVECQRCLDRFDYPLNIDSVFELLAGDVEPTQEEMEDDSRDFLSAADEIDVLALIEDELILAMPVVPRHDDCVTPLPRTSTDEASPFAALAKLGQRLH